MQKTKLKRAREQKGYTQQDMADRLNTTISSYCRKENGITDIKQHDWENLAKILNIPIEEIFEANESVLNNSFYDNSSINNQNISISANMLGYLEDLIALLKEENLRLKEENQKFKGELQIAY